MRNRLSIFSSRILGSALIWTVLAIALIEWRAQRALPAGFANHEVDRMLRDLDFGRVPAADTVFLGDSVGRQISRALLSKAPGLFVPLASNGGIETPGQYHVLLRYLDGHPAPKRIVVMMFNPLEGQLEGEYTENYYQRGFSRWREIGGISWAKRRLSFSLVIVAYKLSPLFRHRVELQKEIPFLLAPLSSGSGEQAATAPPRKVSAEHGLLEIIGAWRKQHRRGPQIAEVYFHRLGRLIEARNIEWIFLAPPLPESSVHGEPDGIFGRQLRQMAQWNSRYPSLRIYSQFRKYPDDWFSDGVHLCEHRLPAVAQDYADMLASLGLGDLQK